MIYKNVETVGGKSNTKPVAIIGNKKKQLAFVLPA